jgi:hypothetical protein
MPAEGGGARRVAGQLAHRATGRSVTGRQHVRNYKRKPGRVNPDKRMARVVELRAEGLSLRQIGERLLCSYQTVANDLARWEREHANVVPLSNSSVKNSPRRGEDLTAGFDSGESNIVSIGNRRKRA